MKSISEKQFQDFADKYFPGKSTHYDETYAFIQAGSMYGDQLHYECDETSVKLHIECSEWRPIRDYLRQNLKRDRLTPSHWNRQDCQWTIDNEIHTDKDVFQAFLDIRSIVEPVIEKFEGKDPHDYSHYTLDEAKAQSTQPKNPLKKQEEINLTLLADKELVVLPDTKIANVQFVSAFLCGGWMGSSVKPEVCQVKRNADELIVQMHLYADNYCKGVQLLLKQKGDDIYGYIEWAKGTKKRGERNEKTEKILQSDWNDTSDTDVANLDTNIPIGKKGYGVEKIILEIAQQKEVSKELENSQEAKFEVAKPQEAKATETVENKIAHIATEKEPDLTVKKTPIVLPPVTFERKIDELGITLTKTYDKFAEAPIQGIDTLGRNTREVKMHKLEEIKDKKEVVLSKSVKLSGELSGVVVKELFGSVKFDGKILSYAKFFWPYLAQKSDSLSMLVETSPELKSTFGIISVDESDVHHIIAASNDDKESVQPSFCFESTYSESEITLEKLVNIFIKGETDDMDDYDIYENFIKVGYKDDVGLEKQIGSYRTPPNYDNTCPKCNGEKKIRCSSCGGSGREQYKEGYYADGRPKIKTGQCSECYGRGFFVCKTCNETGKVDHGKGMIKVMEKYTKSFNLYEETVASNIFFYDNTKLKNDIDQILEYKEKLRAEEKAVRGLKLDLESCCLGLIKQMEDIEEKHEHCHFKSSVFWEDRRSIKLVDFSKPSNAKTILDDWIDNGGGWRLVYSDCGVGDTLSDIEELEKKITSDEKRLKSLNSNLFTANDVEVVFKNQQEVAFDNQHKHFQFEDIEKDKLEFLYQQNLQKVKDGGDLKLCSRNERVVAILEKHVIEDTLFRITVPLESEKIFVVYYSPKKRKLFYSGELPEITVVNELFKEAKMKEEQQKLEKARLKEAARQNKYSQSMDKLLDKEPTKKISIFSKLFKSESYKEFKDAEKAVKLMIYMAKADGVLDIDEKENLITAIQNTFKDAYTAENRQKFIDMLDSDSLPELTKEDVTFSTTKALNKAIKEMEKMAAIGGISSKEKELLEQVRKLAGISM